MFKRLLGISNGHPDLDGNDKVDPAPEDQELTEGRDHKSDEVYAVPGEIVMVDQDLNCLDFVELHIMTLNQRLYESDPLAITLLIVQARKINYHEFRRFTWL